MLRNKINQDGERLLHCKLQNITKKKFKTQTEKYPVFMFWESWYC